MPKSSTVITSVEENFSSTTCSACNQIKPNAQFKRRLTLAHSRAVLRNPNIQTRFTATSKLCKDCQRLRKSTKPLTAKQIRSKISSGDMHAIKGEVLLEKIRQAVPKTRSRVMKEHWHKKRIAPTLELKRTISKQVLAYAKRHYASKNLQNATKEQNAYNYEQAKRIKQDLFERIHGGEQIAPDIEIALLIKPRKEGVV